MVKKLSGRTIVITGASSGAGRAIALCCAMEGARLVLSARRTNALQQLVNDCLELEAEAIFVPADVTNPEEMGRLAIEAINFGGSIDVWVNNASVLAAGAFEETPIQVHGRVIDTNLKGYLNAAHAVIPYFKQQGFGILINNISVGAWFPTPYATAYSASKFGLKGFAEALRAELSQYPDIHVCNLYPGFLDTPGMQHAANYTGKALRPAPPLYDPMDVGRAVVSVAIAPVPSVTIGGAATLLRIFHWLAPKLSTQLTERFMRNYFKNAASIDATNGNLFTPVEYGTTIYGGWTKTTVRSKMIKRGVVMAGIVIGLMILRKKP